jgi:cytochrome c oxidase accessory protein FixG
VVAYFLLVVYNVLPWIDVSGKPSILLDLPRREFTFFGTTFLPTDTLLLMLFIAGVFVAIFLLTALFGRLWCGWACPQTVYMEFVYRPIERLFDGSPDARRRGKPAPGGIRTVLKYVAFFVVSFHLAHTFLAYFVGAERLFDWTRQSPFEHPTAFLIVAATTALMMFDFCFFREQTCIVACPYGRFQSVLLDRNSLIIAYDEERGEPRARLKRSARSTGSDVALPQAGDCVECSMCVTTCPTGIDIRDGLQMECIGCAQCIDACDEVMTRIGRATGLIRYSSREAMEHRRRRVLRPRVVLYPAMLLVIIGAFVAVLVTKQPADITLLRAGGPPYATLDDGRIANDLRVKIVNRTEAPRLYSISVNGIDGASVSGDHDAVAVNAGATITALVTITAPPASFEMGTAPSTVRVGDDAGFRREMRYRLQGPWGGGGGS